MSLVLAAALAAAFNLACSGTQATSARDGLDTTTVSLGDFSDVYRVDLDSGRWCA